MPVHPDTRFRPPDKIWPGRWRLDAGCALPHPVKLQIVDCISTAFRLAGIPAETGKVEIRVFPEARSRQIECFRGNDGWLFNLEGDVRHVDPEQLAAAVRSAPESPFGSGGNAEPFIEPIGNRTRGISILYVREIRDSRWRSTGIPPAVLILAGLAERAGFTPAIRSVSPGENIRLPDGVTLAAIGVYEDLFVETRDILRALKAGRKLRIIAGGPMATLTPLPLLAHLPEADFILRGEVEESFPGLLELLADEMPASGTDEMWRKLRRIPGLAYHNATTLVLNDFHRVPAASSMSDVPMDFQLVSRGDLQKGIEYSTSRGCPRGCTFCSHVHGYRIRTSDMETVDRHLAGFADCLAGFPAGQLPECAWSVNLNDDDLLVDPERTGRLMDTILVKGLKLWGIQSALPTLLSPKNRKAALHLLSRKTYFRGASPILWIGTDAFAESRLRRLKKSGHPRQIREICRDLDARGITGCHYWIMTDGESTWEEFFDELIVMAGLQRDFPATFRVLPNAATLVPYPTTEIYRRHMEQQLACRIIVKEILSHSEFPAFDYPLVRHERPRSSYLYALVEPAAETPEKLLFDPRRFIEWVRRGEFHRCFAEALRACRMEIEGNSGDHSMKLSEGVDLLRRKTSRFEAIWRNL